MSNYQPTGASDDPTNPDASPVIDTWGPNFISGYWSLSDWITWYSALQSAYGQTYAQQQFANQWNTQTAGAAPANDLVSDESARQFFNSNGLSALIPPSLGGILTDVLNTGQILSNASTTAAKAASWVLPLAGIALIYFAVQSLGKDPGGQAKKFAGAARELY